MISLNPNTLSASVIFSLSPPIFDWSNAHSLFFELVHDALTPDYYVDVNDFSVKNGVSLAEVTARYNIIGTRNSVELSADKFSINFSSCSLSDYETIKDIVQKLDQEFEQVFTQHQYQSLELTIQGHFKIKSDLSATEYLESHEVPSISRSFRNSNIIHVPGIRFTNKANDGNWILSCTIELSVFLDNGLFMSFDMLFLKEGTTVSKIEMFKKVIESSMSTLGLEVDGANK